jgi:hypothetical protein
MAIWHSNSDRHCAPQKGKHFPHLKKESSASVLSPPQQKENKITGLRRVAGWFHWLHAFIQTKKYHLHQEHLPFFLQTTHSNFILELYAGYPPDIVPLVVSPGLNKALLRPHALFSAPLCSCELPPRRLCLKSTRIKCSSAAHARSTWLHIPCRVQTWRICLRGIERCAAIAPCLQM